MLPYMLIRQSGADQRKSKNTAEQAADAHTLAFTHTCLNATCRMLSNTRWLPSTLTLPVAWLKIFPCWTMGLTGRLTA